ncbi:unnamed protein product [Rotaria sp. Silwood1]|nr:unnamed protein product [Rotaria sp. Silwood1]CAF1603444.1 unnamed protein product [Rotaria sp. Silwood1]
MELRQGTWDIDETLHGCWAHESIVIAVHGYEDDKGIFIVKDYCFKDLLIPKQLSSLKEDKFFLFASGFLLSETSIIFNQLEYLFLFHNLISYTITDIDIMPGVNDPCCYMLPQQPLHPCMFPSSSKRKTTLCLANPYDFQIVFLQTSGQNLDDIYPLSTIDDRVQILENCLKLCAIAPICPDTLSCYPYVKNDPLIITDIPHVFFAGNQPKFETRVINIDKTNLSNHHMNLMIQPVQNYLQGFIEIVEHLTVWLELEIPSYNDSNDFCIVVQNEILDEIA